MCPRETSNTDCFSLFRTNILLVVPKPFYNLIILIKNLPSCQTAKQVQFVYSQHVMLLIEAEVLWQRE